MTDYWMLLLDACIAFVGLEEYLDPTNAMYGATVSMMLASVFIFLHQQHRKLYFNFKWKFKVRRMLCTKRQHSIMSCYVLNIINSNTESHLFNAKSIKFHADRHSTVFIIFNTPLTTIDLLLLLAWTLL